MATVNFLYRSNKSEAFLNIRLLFRNNEKDFQIGGKSQILVSNEYWKQYHNKKRINEPELALDVVINIVPVLFVVIELDTVIEPEVPIVKVEPSATDNC